jgi:hypothetical protein
MFLGPSACILPVRLDRSSELKAIADGLADAGGSLETYEVEAFSTHSQALLEASYNATRDGEYGELIDSAKGLSAELERERARDKFTFAEVEENEADLARLRRWAARIRWRDVYGASRRAAADTAVRTAQAQLDAFARIAIDRDTEPSGSSDLLDEEGAPIDLATEDR